MIAAEEFSSATRAAHHLVMDEQDAVAVADFTDPGVIAVRPDERGGRRAADRLHDEGDHGFGIFGEDLLLQHVGVADAALFHGEIVTVAPCGGRRHRRHGPHHGRESLGQRVVAGDGKRAQSPAVIRGETGDHLPALRLAGGDSPLPGELDAGFGRFRAAGDEEYAIHALRQLAGQFPRQLFRRLILEMQPVSEGGLVHLALHGVENVAVGMADIGDHRSAGAVDEAAAVLGPEIDAFGAVDERSAKAGKIEQM